MKTSILNAYDLCARHPRLLAGLGLVLGVAFIAIATAKGDSVASLAKPAAGFIAWATLGWYVAEHGDNEADRLIGIVGLLILILASAIGVIGAAFGV